MNKSKIIILSLSFIFASLLSLFTSCNNNEKQENESLNNDTVSKNSGKVLNVKGKLFGIPSPFQISFLVQKLNLPFEKDILSSTQNLNKYKSDFQKSLNLGVYGADLAYVVLFEKNQDALGYLTATKKLAEDLGISSAFDNRLMDRIYKNISNKDSVLILSSAAYRSGNSLLRSNQHESYIALILSGSWIESTNITLKTYSKNQNEELLKRIGEQKQSVNNILELLKQFETESGFQELILGFESLKKVFEKITYKYVFEKPETNASTQTTTIKSKTIIEIKKEHVDEINSITGKLREKIINSN